MKVLILGTSGQVGGELMRALWDPGTLVVGLARPEFDFTHVGTIEEALAQHQPDVVINAAAYTAVDRAEQESATAFAVNSDGPEYLARTCFRKDVPIIHLSTDYVFDGTATKPYHEFDPVAPVNIYGLSKASGEAAVRLRQPHHVILRTGWVYASHGHNFVRTMLRLASERDEIAVVADQRGTPTAARDIATALVTIARCIIAPNKPAVDGIWGTYHFAAQGETSWYGFAEYIIQHYGRVSGRRPTLRAITTAEYPLPAKRPSYTCLDCERIGSVFGSVSAPWRAGLHSVLDELLPATERKSPGDFESVMK